MGLNHRPRPYQGNAVWFYKNLQVPQAKHRASHTRPLKLWVQLWAEDSGFAGQVDGLRAGVESSHVAFGLAFTLSHSLRGGPERRPHGSDDRMNEKDEEIGHRGMIKTRKYSILAQLSNSP